MIHRFLLLTLMLSLPASTLADEDYSWCQGFIVKALGEFPVGGLSRVAMWLDWNEIVSETVVNNSLDEQRYQAGRDHFSRLNSAGDMRGLAKAAEEDCAVGQNPGWVWW